MAIKAILKAPRHSTVLAVSAASASKVTAGQTIAVLDSSVESEQMAKLEAHEAKLSNHLTALNDEKETDRHTTVLKAIVDAQTSRESKLISVAQDTFSEYTLGHTDLPHVYDAQDDWAQSKYDLTVAQLKLDQYPKDLDYTRRHLSLMLELVRAEKQFVQRTIDQATIKAPLSGTLSLFVGVHTPVRRGFVIGEIA